VFVFVLKWEVAPTKEDGKGVITCGNGWLWVLDWFVCLLLWLVTVVAEKLIAKRLPITRHA
jgi:hypothetical protein